MARSSFIANLQTKMKNHEELQTIILLSKKKLLQFETAFRLFDEFPSLLFQDKLLPLTNRFKSIVTIIKPFVETKAGYKPNNPYDAKMIIMFEKEILELACVELLDGNRGIKKEIIEFLKWSDIEISQEKIAAIICAYLSAINQDIFQSIETSNEMDQVKLGQLCDFINKNYGKNWASEVLKENGYEEAALFLKGETSKHFMSIFPAYLSRPISIGLGLTGLGLLMVAGVTLFKAASSYVRNGRLEAEPMVTIPPVTQEFLEHSRFSVASER